MISEQVRASDKNKYGGRCDRCGKRVAAGHGSFRFLKWAELEWPHAKSLYRDVGVLEHWACREKYDGTKHHWTAAKTKATGTHG